MIIKFEAGPPEIPGPHSLSWKPYSRLLREPVALTATDPSSTGAQYDL